MLFLIALLHAPTLASDSIMIHTSNPVPEHCRTTTGINWTCGNVGADDANYEQTNQSGNLVFADFDGDGDIDAAGAALRTTDFQVVFRQCTNDSDTNPWTCSDTPIAELASLGYFQHASAGDIDGDGDPEVIVGDATPFVCDNDNGVISTCTEFTINGEARARYIRDFNGDGLGDTHTFGSQVCDGQGSSFDCASPGNGFDSAIADFNEDGFDDYVNENLVCINDGPGPTSSFSCVTNPATLQGFGLMSGTGVPQSATVGDFNGDSHQDFANGVSVGGQMVVCFGDGTGAFSCAVNATGSGDRAMLGGDFDGDGTDEILTFWFGTPSVCSPNTSGTGSCTLTDLPEININANQLAVAADFGTSPDTVPSLIIGGRCPGILTFDFSGFTPGGTVDLGTASGLGNFTVGGAHTCAGTDVGLSSNARRRASLIVDGNGEATFQRSFINAVSCSNMYYQALDHDTCETLPSPLNYP